MLLRAGEVFVDLACRRNLFHFISLKNLAIHLTPHALPHRAPSRLLRPQHILTARPSWSSLHNLAVHLSSRFDTNGLMEGFHRGGYAAVTLGVCGHPDRHHSLPNLASCLDERYHKKHSAGDLDYVPTLTQTLVWSKKTDPERQPLPPVCGCRK
ncbi:hypothetical protein J3A83DRAFT_186567 [Scleroderma citrinum]